MKGTLMMAPQKIAGNEVIVLSRVLEILHVCLRLPEKHDALYMAIASMPAV